MSLGAEHLPLVVQQRRTAPPNGPGAEVVEGARSSSLTRSPSGS